jgi:hypothetical protein
VFTFIHKKERKYGSNFVIWVGRLGSGPWRWSGYCVKISLEMLMAGMVLVVLLSAVTSLAAVAVVV